MYKFLSLGCTAFRSLSNLNKNKLIVYDISSDKPLEDLKALITVEFMSLPFKCASSARIKSVTEIIATIMISESGSADAMLLMLVFV